ncbi:4643_t:CDS:2 [Entrophospora sp. SA101]|nr:4643_t:CDS:2 [Entrophospora sp. SA101]
MEAFNAKFTQLVSNNQDSDWFAARALDEPDRVINFDLPVGSI